METTTPRAPIATNYFRVFKEVYFFDDNSEASIARAWNGSLLAQAKASQGRVHKVTICAWRVPRIPGPWTRQVASVGEVQEGREWIGRYGGSN